MAADALDWSIGTENWVADLIALAEQHYHIATADDLVANIGVAAVNGVCVIAGGVLSLGNDRVAWGVVRWKGCDGDDESEKRGCSEHHCNGVCVEGGELEMYGCPIIRSYFDE